MNKKNNLIALRIDNELKEKLEELAFESGSKKNVSDYIRKLLKENVDLIEKQKEEFNRIGFEFAMKEIYINTNYKYFNKIRTNNEKIVYSNQFIDLILEEVEKNKGKKIEDIMSMAMIRYSLDSCSKYSTDENIKVYKLLQTSYNDIEIENMFLCRSCEIRGDIEALEKTSLEKIILDKDISDNFSNLMNYLKLVYIKNKVELLEIEEMILINQFEWRYLKQIGEYEGVKALYNEMQEHVSKESAIKKVITDILKESYNTPNYNNWYKEYLKNEDISSLDRLELKGMMNNKSYWELEAELIFKELIKDIEIDIVFPE